MRPQSNQGFLVICLLVFVASRAEHSEEDHVEMEEDKIILGIYIVYDDAFTKGFLFNKGDKPFNDYFTALCNAAEAYFKDLRDPRVMLALAGTSRLEEKNIIQTTLKDSKTYVDGEKTLDKFYDIMTWNESLPEGVDVVFLVTGTETWITEEAVTNQWKGLAAPKSICFSAKTLQAKAVGIVYDDGKNFNGVPVLALQVAILLGASKDSKRGKYCPSSEGYLTSSKDGGSRPALSACSRSALREFYFKNKDKDYICWNDFPKAAQPKNKRLPVDFYQEKDHDICESESKRRRTLYTCEASIAQ
ncbi:uncharacterized protein LOC144094486 [Amblyomma americanum]